MLVLWSWSLCSAVNSVTQWESRSWCVFTVPCSGFCSGPGADWSRSRHQGDAEAAGEFCSSLCRVNWCGDVFMDLSRGQGSFTGPQSGLVGYLNSKLRPDSGQDVSVLPCIESDHDTLVVRSLIVQEEETESFSRVWRTLSSFGTLTLSDSSPILDWFSVLQSPWLTPSVSLSSRTLAVCPTCRWPSPPSVWTSSNPEESECL